MDVLSAVARVNRLVPASADSEIPAFGNEVSDARIAHTAQDFRRAVGRMVIDDDYVEFEIGASAPVRFVRRPESSARDFEPV